MSALTLRKKRNLGNCITNSTLNPKRQHLLADYSRGGFEGEVELFAREQMENGIHLGKIDQKELLSRLQVFDSSASEEEIRRLLRENQNDFVSVMNILKEKSDRKSKQKRERKMLFGGQLKDRITAKLKEKRKPKNEPLSKPLDFEESPSESPEQVQKRQSLLEKSINSQALVERILMCSSNEDVQEIAMEIAQEYNDTIRKLKRCHSENYILKMGICQRRAITQQEIKKRVEVEKKLKETENEVERLVQSQNQLQQSWNGGWMQNHFGREGF